MNFRIFADFALISAALYITSFFIRNRLPKWAGPLLLISSFIFTSIALNRFDVMGKNFDSSGFWLFTYNFLRTISLVFWALIFCNTGVRFYSLAARKIPYSKIRPFEFALACFFAGAAVCSLVFFLLGLVGMLRIEIAVIYGVVFLIFNRSTTQLYLDCYKTLLAWFRALPSQEKIVSIFGLLLLGIFSARLFFVNAIYPAGSGCDVYNHYLPYLKEVVRSGGTTPNDIWYHFFYSKGLGISFFTALTGGIFGPKLVSFLLLLMCSGLVAHLIFRLTKSSLYALLSAILFLEVFATANSSSAEFFKHHILVLCFLFATFWFLMLNVWGNRAAYVLPGAASCAICGVIASPTSLPFFGLLIALSLLLHLLGKKWTRATKLFVLGASLVITFALLLGLNYLLTGLFLETPIRLFWSMADSTRFSHWVSPYLVQYLLEGSGTGVGNISLARLREIDLNWFTGVLRLNLLRSLVPPLNSPLLYLVPIIAVYFLFKKESSRVRSLLLIAGVFLVACVLLSKLIAQESSIYRMYIFAVPFSVTAVIMIWYSAFRSVMSSTSAARLAGPCLLCLPIIAFSYAGLTRMPYDLAGASISLQQTLSFYLGKQSIRKALDESGQLWVAAEKAGKIVGPNSKVVTFVINGGVYGASPSFPGNGLLTEVNLAITPHWHDVVFGSAQEAKKILLNDKITGFIFDIKDPMMFGGIPYSDLFSADSIHDNFNLHKLGPTTYLAELTASTPSHPWPLDVARAFQIKRESLAALKERADFREIFRASIRRDLETKKIITNQQAFHSVAPALSLYLKNYLSSDVATAIIRETETQITSKPMTEITQENVDASANEVETIVDEIARRYIAQEVGAETFELLKDDRHSAKMKNVYDAVHTIYRFNSGNISNIVRPTDLPQSSGWQ